MNALTFFGASVCLRCKVYLTSTERTYCIDCQEREDQISNLCSDRMKCPKCKLICSPYMSEGLGYGILYSYDCVDSKCDARFEKIVRTK